MSRGAVWVVPCYNEAARLDEGAFLSAADGGASLIFVDDGSNDDTPRALGRLAELRPLKIRVLSLGRNLGKAEAVRRGLAEALRAGHPIVAYLDADLATPVAEMQRLERILVERDVDVVLGTRVSMLGRHIVRSSLRHYLGRIFASVASALLHLRVYDTQCGAKILRSSPALDAALRDPFLSRWAFDVELLGRLLIGAPGCPGVPPDRIVEEPLFTWRDVAGSKLRPDHMFRAAADLARIARDLEKRRGLAR